MRKWAPKVFNVSTGNSVSTVLKLWFLCQTKPIWSTLYAYFSHQSFPIRSHYKLISSSVHIYTGVVSQSWWPCHPTWAVWAVTKWPLFGIQTVMHHNKLPCYRYCKGDDKENHPPNPPPPPPPQVRCQLEDGTSWTNGLMTWSRDHWQLIQLDLSGAHLNICSWTRPDSDNNPPQSKAKEHSWVGMTLTDWFIRGPDIPI